ncbi:CRISPR-associated protein Cas2 [Crossiella equi]|uniref:CRISPR-associated protein Cas2 n=1 Tax=Crossiella equi TaxID=130796 RepID=A0ABS5AM33_9PSEU|nr:type I-E CRISPR-associated endoribonuclease Cas2e [Crossiella equi]MBP2477618.1 CRISPR-associated protein Cas2 [Crossiella equi]
MVVLATTAVPDHVHGALSRWLLEAMPGMFVGSVSARVRDLLWDNVSAVVGEGAAVLVHPADNEQGFALRTAGDRRRQPYELDGLTLIRWRAPVQEAEEVPVPW